MGLYSLAGPARAFSFEKSSNWEIPASLASRAIGHVEHYEFVAHFQS